MDQIVTKCGLVANLNEANNTWYILRSNGHKIGFINEEATGIFFTNRYTAIDARELNAIVDILDRAYEKKVSVSQITKHSK